MFFFQYTSDGGDDTFSPDVDPDDVKSIEVRVTESTGSYTIKSIEATVCCSPVGEYEILHYSDVIMGVMASQITSLTVVYSTVYSGADQRNIKAPRH